MLYTDSNLYIRKIKVTFSVIGSIDSKNSSSISNNDYLIFKNKKVLNFLGQKKI